VTHKFFLKVNAKNFVPFYFVAHKSIQNCMSFQVCFTRRNPTLARKFYLSLITKINIIQMNREFVYWFIPIIKVFKKFKV
jgi:hypothetical protein